MGEGGGYALHLDVCDREELIGVQNFDFKRLPHEFVAQIVRQRLLRAIDTS